MTGNININNDRFSYSQHHTVVYFLSGEGKMADVDEKIDDVVLTHLPVVVLLSLLVVIHHPLLTTI